MRVLFVQPDMTFQKHHPLVYKGFAATVPLGIAYMSAYLERAGHTVAVVDYQVGQYDIAREIERYWPDVFGVSLCSPAVPHASELVRTARRVAPDVRILAGGPHVSAYREAMLDTCPELDLLVVGEGERTLLDLVARWSGGRSVRDVPGIIYRDGPDKVATGPGREIPDLAELPRMPLHLFDIARYYPLPGTFRRLPSIAMATSRGCPFPCTFCNSKDIWNKRVRMRPPEAVVDEIASLVARYGAREIYFVDELFTLKRAHVVTFCEDLLHRGIRIGWKCCSRVDTVDRELLELMKRSGCFMISYGVESGDDRILEIMKKGITTDQVVETFRVTREVGIARMAFFMLNSYGETRATVEKTLALSREIEPDFLNFELFKPFPGIEMRRMIEADPACSIRRDIWDDWEAFTVGNRIFYTQNDLDEDYLKEVYARAIRGFYLTPSFILKSLAGMRSFDQFKSYFKTFLNMLSVRLLEDGPRAGPAGGRGRSAPERARQA